MEKLIQSKHFANKCPDLRKTQSRPKQLLLSNNWVIRNDSGNVAAVLHPDDYLEKPRKYLDDVPCKPGRTNETGVYRRRCLSSNTCYCKEEALEPLLLRRPNKCLSLEEFDERFKNKFCSSRSSLHCFCKENYASANHIDLSDQAILKKYQDELADLNKNLQITDQRKDYEIFRDQEHEQYLKDIDQRKTSTIRSTLASNSRSSGSSGFIAQGTHSEDLNMYPKRYAENITAGEDRYEHEYQQSGDQNSNDAIQHQRHTTSLLDKYGNDKFRNKNTFNHRDHQLDYTKYSKESTDRISLGNKATDYDHEDKLLKERLSFQKYKGGSSILDKSTLTRHGLPKHDKAVMATNGINKYNSTNHRTARRDHPRDNLIDEQRMPLGYSADYLQMPGENSSEELAEKQYSIDSSMNTPQFRKFRDENYFETHGVDESLAEEIPIHTCVHKYELDDRGVPKGVNVDIYGKSRCSICNKCLEDIPDKNYFNDGITYEKLRSISKCYQLGLAPNTIVSSKSSVKVKVSHKDGFNFDRFIGQYQRPAYTNTFALRQQKMAIYRY